MGEIPHIPVEIEVSFSADANDFEEAVRSAGTPTEEIRGDTLGDLLSAWGWGITITSTINDRIHVYFRSTYGDWTWTEDDEKLFTTIIPWLLSGSYIVFEKARLNPPDHYYGITELEEYEVWLFDGTEVERKSAEKVDSWEW